MIRPAKPPALMNNHEEEVTRKLYARDSECVHGSHYMVSICIHYCSTDPDEYSDNAENGMDEGSEGDCVAVDDAND